MSTVRDPTIDSNSLVWKFLIGKINILLHHLIYYNLSELSFKQTEWFSILIWVLIPCWSTVLSFLYSNSHHHCHHEKYEYFIMCPVVLFWFTYGSLALKGYLITIAGQHCRHSYHKFSMPLTQILAQILTSEQLF